MTAARHRKPNWVGKPAAQMRADADQHRDQQPITETCLFCDWTYTGNAADGRDAARTHRQQKHPLAVGRKTYRKPRGYRLGYPVDDEVIEENRRARLAREEAERLATIERGRIRREQAA